MDRKKLALIHIIKKELKLDDTEYRGILQQVAGVTSAKDLDDEKFRKLMNYFVRSKYYQVNPFGLTMKQKLYIKYLMQQVGWQEGHLNNFLQKYYHKDGIDKLTKEEAIKAIESLKNVKEHGRAAQVR
jgi:phage gp16-like protein